MHDQQHPHQSPPLPKKADSSPWRFAGPRFSMRTLLIVVTAFAVLCGLVSRLPVYVSQTIVGAFWIASAGWLIAGVIFAKEDQRAFCIGAGIVVSSTWTGVGARFAEGMARLLAAVVGLFGGSFSTQISLWLDFLLICVAAVANGWLCVRARRYFESSVK